MLTASAQSPAAESGQISIRGPLVSFEVFPPKSEQAAAGLWQAIGEFGTLGPRFISVTYGAGGSTRERTFDLVTRIRREGGVTPAAHLTCVGATRGEIDRLAEAYWQAGISHLVALRGDGLEAGPYRPAPDGYPFAADLVAGLRRIADFDISVAAYPETHPEARTAADDLDNLKRKLDAGACRAITQFFFDPAVFLRFRDRASRVGIDAPLVPGILPIVDFARARNFALRCGTSVPDWLDRLFQDAEEDPAAQQRLATAVATEQCRRLMAEGVDAFHFYTLNRADLTGAVVRLLRTPLYAQWRRVGPIGDMRGVA